jgi:hypothetical protein
VNQVDIASSCTSCERSCESNRLLCARCEKYLLRALDAIPRLFKYLEAHPESHMRSTGYDQRRGSSFGPPAPVDLDVLTLLHPASGTTAVLYKWVRAIDKQAGFKQKLTAHPAFLAARLALLLPWATQRFEDIAHLKQEVVAEHSKLERATMGDRRPPKPVPCPVFVPEVGQCTGRLFLHRDGTVSCAECGSVWEYEQWSQLGRLMQHD